MPTFRHLRWSIFLFFIILCVSAASIDIQTLPTITDDLLASESSHSVSISSPPPAHSTLPVKGNHPPRFVTDSYGHSGSEIVVVVKEGPDSVGKEILRVSGEDPDGDDLQFGVQGGISVSPTSSSSSNDLIKIVNGIPSKNSAIIYLNKELDRETKDSYTIVLTLTDFKLGAGKFVTKTILLIVEDVNDNDPIFKPYRSIISLPENTRLGVIESIEAYDVDAGRFGQVLYRLQEVDQSPGRPDIFRIETIEGKGVISLVSPLDYERKSVYNLKIYADDRGLEGEKRTSIASIQVHVKDVNDNPPRFVKKVFTGGVTTEADYGASVLFVKAVDADSGPNGEVKYHINGTIRRRGPSFGFEGMRMESPFLLNRKTGEITLNFDPRKDMKGYFEFDVIANDSAGFFDSAKVFIYLLREDQRVRFVLRLAPNELREKLDKFLSVLSNITGAIVNVDGYKYHETFDGNVDKRRTDLYLHFVNPNDHTILEVETVLMLIDKNSEYLDELYKEFNVLLSEPSVDRKEFILWEDQLKACLFGVTAFLALLLVLVTCLCLSQRVRYERLLKAATTSSAMYPDRHLTRTNVPNTNIHADEGSNPIWMTGYDNEWYEKDDDERISDRSTGNSLDENAVTEMASGSEGEPTTPTDSLNGSGRCSDSIKNDRASLCRNKKGVHQKITLPLKSKVGGGGGGNNNNNRSQVVGQQSRPSLRAAVFGGSGGHRNNKRGQKRLSLTNPRPPISLPIPIHPSAVPSLPPEHSFSVGPNAERHPHHLFGNHHQPFSSNATTNKVTSTNTLGRNHEVTCKNSINTIYISSHTNQPTATSATTTSTSQGSTPSTSLLANNLSMISLETTEL